MKERFSCSGGARSHTQKDEPFCREMQSWAQSNGWQDKDGELQPVLQWMELGQKPQWAEVAGASPATKGLFVKFEALRLSNGVLQRAWKELDTGGKVAGGGHQRNCICAEGCTCDNRGRTLWGFKNPPEAQARVLLGPPQKGCEGLLLQL